MKILTDWFPGTVNPVRRGLYLVERWRGDAGAVFFWKAGDWWELPGYGAAVELRGSRWRGLAFDPAAAIPEIDAEDGSPGWLVKVPR